MRLTRKAREQYRHSRAVVLQELGAQPAASVLQDIEHNKRVAAKLAADAKARAARNTTDRESTS